MCRLRYFESGPVHQSPVLSHPQQSTRIDIFGGFLPFVRGACSYLSACFRLSRGTQTRYRISKTRYWETMLTDAKIRAAQPGTKGYKLFDAQRLYLFVTPKGAKSWRMNFVYDGKNMTTTFGQYPRMSLAEARLLRDEARRQLEQGLSQLHIGQIIPDRQQERPEHCQGRPSGLTFGGRIKRIEKNRDRVPINQRYKRVQR